MAKKSSSKQPPPPVKETCRLGALGAFSCLAVCQICSAYLNPIADCDEVYNFWEPLHLFLFGRGLQTWEYSPDYALRSYAYVLFGSPYVPVWILIRMIQIFEIFLDKRTIFYLSRATFGLVDAWANARFYSALVRALSPTIGLIFLITKSLGTGSFVAGTSFLPSSFAGFLLTFSYANFLDEKNYFLAIFQVALAALLGWPFAAILGLPYALDVVFSANFGRKLVKFVTYSLIAGGLICVLMLLIDSFFYGRWVLAPLNIVKYNVFGGRERGSELYGTEPWTFYVLNLLLNWNLAIPAAFLALPILLYLRFVRRSQPTRSITLMLMLQAPLYAWMAVFWSQPHKEERFLFPVYSSICASAAVTLAAFFHGFNTSRYRKIARFSIGLFLVAFSALSLSRTAALVRNYRAPLEVYGHLADIRSDDQYSNGSMRVCVGKEWYRFPGSFFLPNNASLGFVKSKFDGILPSDFDAIPAPGGDFRATARTTRRRPRNMNDRNLEEPSRYVDLWTQCDYLVDLDRGQNDNPSGHSLEPNYSKMGGSKFVTLFTRPFLLADRSHRFFRAFYVPYFSDYRCVFGDYNLLKVVRRDGP